MGRTLMGMTAMNEQAWGMPVVIYLFLAGLGAGSFLLGVIASCRKEAGWEAVSRMAFLLAPFAIFLGLLMLIFDLGYKIRFWRTLTVLNITSPMSVGVWLLSSFFLVSMISAIFRMPASLRSHIPLIGETAFWNDPKWSSAIGKIGVPLALGVSVYTGVLLSVTAVPLWRNVSLPILFFISALSLGMESGAILGMLSLRKENGELMKAPLKFLQRSYRIMLPLYLAAALLYAVVLAASSKAALIRLSTGWSGWAWWAGVVGAGILFPMLLVMRKSSKNHAWLLSSCILLGDFLLRMVLILTGQKAM
jgi:formate-dependent nitrite reductase membrane component NrfD